MGRRYKQGTARSQEALLLPRIEDYIGADNLVRAIDAYVETLDLAALGFVNASGDLAPGQPAFDPAALLKLYLVGYLNRVHSSRRLARECQRNLEAIWLLEGRAPGYRTIAEFRRVNGPALKATCREFVAVCKELDLLGGEVVGIAGTFVSAWASDASVVIKTRLERELKQIELDIDAYYRGLDAQDEQEREAPGSLAANPPCPRRSNGSRSARRAGRRRSRIWRSAARPNSRVLTRRAGLHKRGQQTVGYNVQSVVDHKHRLIAHHEVTNAGNDSGQLAAQAIAAKEVLGVAALTVVADAGYYSEAELAACAQANIAVYVPIPDKYQPILAAGRFSGAQFQYVAGADAYVCPGGEVLRPQGKPAPIYGILRQRYTRAPNACHGCPLKCVCLPAKTPRRQLYRTEHAAVPRSTASAWPRREPSGCASAPAWSSTPSAPSNAGSAGITSWCAASRRSAARWP